MGGFLIALLLGVRAGIENATFFGEEPTGIERLSAAQNFALAGFIAGCGPFVVGRNRRNRVWFVFAGLFLVIGAFFAITTIVNYEKPYQWPPETQPRFEAIMRVRKLISVSKEGSRDVTGPGRDGCDPGVPCVREEVTLSLVGSYSNLTC